MAIAQLAKKHGMQMRYIPLMNIVVSIIIVLLLTPTLPLTERVIQGLVTGLSASGFYDACKSFKKYETEEFKM